MFGFKFIKAQPTDYLLHYRGGRVIREGVGLSFFYFTPASSLVLVPSASVDAPFIFEEVTADFQSVTIQGQITYKVADPKKLSQLMNFTLAADGKGFTTDDPKKLPQRLINHTQVLARSSLKGMSLREVLGSSDKLVVALRDGLRNAEAINSVGVEILNVSILAVKPTPDTARALEAEAREEILRQADEAIYLRRNAAVEQERAIQENELNTEIAVENKKREIRETQMEAEKAVHQKKRELQHAEMETQITLEERDRELVALTTENVRQQADTKAYGIGVVMKALSQADPKTLQVLANVGMEPSQLIALAFKSLAEGESKIGHLNISPDLLRELLAKE